MNKLQVLIPLALATALAGCSDSKDNYRLPMQNATPVAEAAGITTQADTEASGMLTGTDADGDSLMFVVATEPAQGTLMLEPDGRFTYLPKATYTGSDQFTFTVSDGRKSSAAASVDILIDPLEVAFGAYSRAAFEQAASDEPLPLNGRVFEQDVTRQDAYDDLLL